MARGYLSSLGGVPTLVGGYLPWMGGTNLGQGVPTLAGGTYLGQGVPILAGGYLPWPKGYLPCPRWYPSGVNRQTPVKTVPSRRTTYAGGNYRKLVKRVLTAMLVTKRLAGVAPKVTLRNQHVIGGWGVEDPP